MKGLSTMKKRDPEKRKRQRERRKARKHLDSSEGVSEDICNSSTAAKGVLLFSAI